MSMTRYATDALFTHDALVSLTANEPDSDRDPYAWLAWQDRWQSAYAKWSIAMDALAAALNEPTMSRHPHNFRPRCEALLKDDSA